MSRRERRAMGDPPAGYIETIQKVHSYLESWLANRGTKPRFALPPREMLLSAYVNEVPKIALDDGARELLDKFCEIALAVGQREPLTVFMLDAVLRLARVPVERVSLADLGLSPEQYRLIPKHTKGTPVAETSHLEPTPCPGCGASIDAVTPVGHRRSLGSSPAPIIVCGYCAAILQYNPALGLVRLAKIPDDADDESRRIREAAQAGILQHNKSRS